MPPVHVFTMRMSDSGPVPRFLGESHVGVCARCKEPVWVTSTTITKLEEGGYSDNYEMVCNVCAPDVIGEVELDEVDFESSDPRLQKFADRNKEDLLDWFRRRGGRLGCGRR